MSAIEESKPKLPKELELAQSLTTLLDDRFRIPIIGVRFGVDSLLGLIPVAGDAVSFAISGLIISTFIRHGMPKRLVARMVLNSGLDFMFGSIPVLGDVFDMAFKANRRNLKLATDHFTKQTK